MFDCLSRPSYFWGKAREGDQSVMKSRKQNAPEFTPSPFQSARSGRYKGKMRAMVLTMAGFQKGQPRSPWPLL